MNKKLKYFLINNPRDFERGLYDRMVVTPEGLRFSSHGEVGVGMFVTRLMDSAERGMNWHRILITAKNCTGREFRVTVYAADTEEFTRDGVDYTLSALFADTTLPLTKKLELFEPFAKKKLSEAADILLHEVSGRFIWFLIEVYNQSEAPALLTEIRVYLPSRSWMEELPQIYQQSDRDTRFLERYLAIFQTVHEELNAQIAQAAYYFDPECTEYEFLLWLADWVDIADSWLWEEEKLRAFLLRALSLYRRRGTRESLAEIIELYTGEPPHIIEEHQLKQYSGTPFYTETLLPLYGDDPYTVTILISSTAVKTEHEYNALKKIAEEMLPVPLTAHIVLLEPYIFAGKFSYLGVNSALGHYKPAAFDGRSALMLSSLQHPDEESTPPESDSTTDS